MPIESSRAHRRASTPPGSSAAPLRASRGPSPVVPPISISPIRYEQVRNGLVEGFGQMGGYLAAVDAASSERLWALKVYDNQRDPSMEGDVQDVFFRAMTLQADGTLLVENERGGRFIVDTAARTSVPAPDAGTAPLSAGGGGDERP